MFLWLWSSFLDCLAGHHLCPCPIMSEQIAHLIQQLFLDKYSLKKISWIVSLVFLSQCSHNLTFQGYIPVKNVPATMVVQATSLMLVCVQYFWYIPGIYPRKKDLGTFCTTKPLDSIQENRIFWMDNIPVKWNSFQKVNSVS